MILIPHPNNIKILSKHFCLKYQVLLLSDEKNNLYIASIQNPMESIVQEVINTHFNPAPQYIHIHTQDFYRYAKFLDFQENLLKLQSHIESLFLLILEQAIFFEASDIHIESFMDGGILRFRIHGDLEIASCFDTAIFKALCSKIKLESKLDISNIQQSQDGRYSTKINNKDYDFRISCVPLYKGESIVIRILYKDKNRLELKDLNITPKHLQTIYQAINKPYGILLVAGPTGSGKTTTLYAILQHLQKENKKIITLEDPPEYQMHFATQVKISSENQFDFKDALKAILRHDPDIIMVGEIRDEATLNLAFRAALTGHLVLATLHSNDCKSSLHRISNMGLEQQDILNSLIAIIAQRLYKKPCPYCSKNIQKGCNQCNMQGILGREIATEVLFLDKATKKAIQQNTLDDFLENSDFETLEKNLHDKIQQGLITTNV